jgi:peptide/nickel transport system substrate-binding protein
MKSKKLGSAVLGVAAGAIALAIAAAAHGQSPDQKVIVALSRSQPHLDRQMLDGTLDTIGNVTDPVFRMDQNRELQPGLAKSWEVIDAETLKITLQDNVVFSNGEKLDAKGFKVSMDRMLSPDSTAGAEHFGSIKDVEVVDDYTVVIHHKPDVGLMTELATRAAIYAPDVVRNNPDSLQTNPIGSGPYVVQSYDPGRDLQMTARDDYWGKDVFGKPTIKEVEFLYGLEPGVRLSMLKAGEANLIQGLGPDDAAQLSDDQVVSMPGPETYYLRFGLKDKLTQDIRVRQAINLAVDRQALTGIFAGRAEAADQLWPGQVHGWVKREIPTPDIAQAQALIEQAGVKGQTIRILFSSDYKPGVREITQAVAAMIEKTGLKVELTETDRPSYVKAMRLKDPEQLLILANGYETMEAAGVVDVRITCNGAISTYCNPEVDKLAAEAKGEPDVQKRTQLLQLMMDKVQADVPVIPLVNPRLLWGKSADLKITPSPFAGIPLLDMGF